MIARQRLPSAPPSSPATRRVGLLFSGDVADPGAWSGIPFALARALGDLGVEILPFDVRPLGVASGVIVNGLAVVRAGRRGLAGVSHPLWTLKHARREARVTPAMASLVSAGARRRLRGQDRCDAVVQIHAEFRAPDIGPLATYEDMTVAQAVRHRYAEFSHLSPGERRRRTELQRRVYTSAKACCTTTYWARSSIVDDYGVAAERVRVVGIGTDQAVVEHARDWSVPRFLFVGQDWERKNGDAVLRSFERLRRTRPDAELHLVGGHPRVDLEGVVGHGVLRLGVTEDRRALRALYRLATCLVLPSLVEPSAIVHVEAGAFGVPSIGTTIGGSRELIGDGGRVVDPHDDRALLDALAELSRPETAASLGERAQRRAPLYTWSAVAARMLTALGVPGFVEPELQPPA